VTNDTLAVARRLGRPAARPAASTRRRRLRATARATATSGRWSALQRPEQPDPADALVVAESLVERHGLVTRGAVQAERRSYAALYRALAALEDRGRCRRGYVVAGLGGSQFGLPSAIDRIRAAAGAPADASAAAAHVLAAADPANPYGAAVAWPQSALSARPGRKAGALVVLVEGRLVAYVERGGASVLAFTDDGADLQIAAEALVRSVTGGAVPALAVKKVNSGAPDSGFGDALIAAGAARTPGAVRIRR
jgi:ATP-dependent Lhr-like helicase